MKRTSQVFAVVAVAVLSAPLAHWLFSRSGSEVPPSPSVAVTPLERLQQTYQRFEAARLPVVEDHIAECMHRRGFTYVPDVQAQTQAPADTLDAEEFVRRFGYGIVAPAVYPGMFVAPDRRDRNAVIRRNLPKESRRRYDRALYGDERDEVVVSVADGRATASFFPHSCVTRAQDAVFGDQRAMTRATARLNLLLPTLRTQIEDDPRVVKPTAQWSLCMRSRSYEFDDSGEARDYVARRVMQAEQADEGLQAVAQVELQLAADDRACMEEVGLTAAITSVTTEYEEAFIQEHPSIIDEVWGAPADSLELQPRRSQ